MKLALDREVPMSVIVKIKELSIDQRILVPGLQNIWGVPALFWTSQVSGHAILTAGEHGLPANISEMIERPIAVTPGMRELSDAKQVAVGNAEVMQELPERYDYLIQGPVTDVLMTGEIIVEARGFSFLLPYIAPEKLPQDNEWLSLVAHGLHLWLEGGVL